VKSFPAVVAIFVLAIVATHAKPAFRTLHFTTNGNYRFDAGPELNLHQLETEIRRMADRRICPDVHLAPDKLASYARVALALTLFQKYGCNDLGFRGAEFMGEKTPLMARCRKTMGHGDPRWSKLERFEICMTAKDYHLRSNPKCMDRENLSDPVSPTQSAIEDPTCWFYANSNFP
jgi:hypothetical protein